MLFIEALWNLLPGVHHGVVLQRFLITWSVFLAQLKAAVFFGCLWLLTMLCSLSYGKGGPHKKLCNALS